MSRSYAPAALGMGVSFFENSPKTRFIYLYRYVSSSSIWDSYGEAPARKELPEVQAANRLTEFIRKNAETKDGKCSHPDSSIDKRKNYQNLFSKEEYLLSLDTSMATLALHVNARIASSVGKGFYTIGPCGEESLAPVGVLLKEYDSSALHYRHTAISLARQLQESNSNSNTDSTKNDALWELLVGRARGYVASKHDPVTGGVHCCIGGGKNEFVVTSTLASQCPSAVGRALGYSLARKLQTKENGNDTTSTTSSSSSSSSSSSTATTTIYGRSHQKQRPISFVTIGDGSLHNHHFLSSWTLSLHARHRNNKCPVVFGISDNGFSISYRTQGFVDAFFRNSDKSDGLCPVFRVRDASNMLEVYSVTQKALDYSRKQQSPSVVLYQNLKRRFGHAATDRQFTYMSNQEIQDLQTSCNIQESCVQAVETLGYATYGTLLDRWNEIQILTEKAFETAIQEPSVTLSEMMNRVAVPIAPIPTPLPIDDDSTSEDTGEESPRVMRKHMTRFLSEAMATDESVVYLGEDVRHGGYYLVTDSLADKYSERVMDFPPDETTLLGASLGFSQLGLTPIVEVPYTKYLDCGADLFNEIAVQHWLTNGNGHGMVIRLQGFDRGVFGGNFHTHNSLAHIPPGIDVVCFSNGNDWVQGARHALWQAKHGRIVVVVDCTELLNKRHLHEKDKDRAWECLYPKVSSDSTGMMSFDTVIRYSGGKDGEKDFPFIREKIDTLCSTKTTSQTNTLLKGSTPKRRIAIVTYGNGVVASLQASRELLNEKWITADDELDVIDCPYLSDVPRGLKVLLRQNDKYDYVLFGDICKEGPGSNVFSSMITTLQKKNLLPESWAFVGAPRTYNPLGSTVTFLNSDRIKAAVLEMILRTITTMK